MIFNRRAKTRSAEPAAQKKSASKTEDEPPRPLRETAREAIDAYLIALDGAPCSDLHEMVMAQVEEPLLAAVMEHTAGNQSRASELLGLNRGTLRKKLRQYGLLDT